MPKRPRNFRLLTRPRLLPPANIPIPTLSLPSRLIADGLPDNALPFPRAPILPVLIFQPPKNFPKIKQYIYFVKSQIIYKYFIERRIKMSRLTTGLIGIGGVTVGLLIGAGFTISAADSRQRRRMIRDSKRAMRKAGHYINDIFE
jgi:hypothetical protein